MALITERKIYDIIGDIYASASSDSIDGWQDTYVKICSLVDAGPGSLNIFDKRTATFTALGDTNHNGFVDEFNSHYYSLLPFRKNIEALHTGQTFDRERDFSDRAYLDSELYRKYFGEMGLYHIVHHCLIDADSVASTITLSRPKGRPNFGGPERRALGMIIPHLRHTMRHYIELSNARWKERLSSVAFERMTHSVMVVDAAHRVVYSNRRCPELIEHNDGIAISQDGRIKVNQANDARRLRAALEGIFSSRANAGKQFGAAPQVSRNSGARPYQLVISRIFEPNFRQDRAEALAMIIITDPERTVSPSDKVLVDLFDMTPAEARISALLASGMDINDVCKELQITCNTVRTHLKHIFSKTDTHRHSELVTLISKLPF